MPWSACSSKPSSRPQLYPPHDRDGLIARLNRVREISHTFGHGVGDDLDYSLAKYVK